MSRRIALVCCPAPAQTDEGDEGDEETKATAVVFLKTAMRQNPKTNSSFLSDHIRICCGCAPREPVPHGTSCRLPLPPTPPAQDTPLQQPTPNAWAAGLRAGIQKAAVASDGSVRMTSCSHF